MQQSTFKVQSMKEHSTCERQAASQSHDPPQQRQPRSDLVSPRVPSTATLTYCSTATSAHTPPPLLLVPSPSPPVSPASQPALATDGAARPRLWRPLICLRLCCGTAGVLIPTAETTMNAFAHNAGRREEYEGTPEDLENIEAHCPRHIDGTHLTIR